MYLVLPDGGQLALMENEDATQTVAQAGCNWTFGVEFLRGLSSLGTWQVMARDALLGATGFITDGTLEFFVAAASANDTYTFTNDFMTLRAPQPTRGTLTDTDGGTDWINLSAIAGNVVSSLAAGGQTQVGDGNDSVVGNALVNHIMGGRGNDRLTGYDGDDTLTGGLGDDVLNGGLGHYTLNGGAGSDTALFTGTANTRVDLNVAGRQNTGPGMDQLIGIEHATSGSGHDRLVGNTQASRLTAGAGNDVLIAGGGNDVLYGQAGNATMHGGTGNDVLTGGMGSDNMSGGDAIDRFVYTSGAEIGIGSTRDTVSDFTSGTDKLDFHGMDMTYRGTAAFTGAGNELRFLSSGTTGTLIGDMDGDMVLDFSLALLGATSIPAGDLML
ncbi:MAG: M10 family metallopeptidase C-terminal domain-containing protein [Gemmobacter sp.]|nr:M10 family metallopeptidase C-terminal domain-containing protein [Gemmobacter sp.]